MDEIQRLSKAWNQDSEFDVDARIAHAADHNALAGASAAGRANDWRQGKAERGLRLCKGDTAAIKTDALNGKHSTHNVEMDHQLPAPWQGIGIRGWKLHIDHEAQLHIISRIATLPGIGSINQSNIRRPRLLTCTLHSSCPARMRSGALTGDRKVGGSLRTLQNKFT
jgi:hypothetical protein